MFKHYIVSIKNCHKVGCLYFWDKIASSLETFWEDICPINRNISLTIPKAQNTSVPWGLFQNPKVRQEIAQLDAEKDCQRIVFLLKAYEFPSDLNMPWKWVSITPMEAERLLNFWITPKSLKTLAKKDTTIPTF